MLMISRKQVCLRAAFCRFLAKLLLLSLLLAMLLLPFVYSMPEVFVVHVALGFYILSKVISVHLPLTDLFFCASVRLCFPNVVHSRG